MTESGLSCAIEEYVGGGGQGEVYRVRIGGRTMALKWYYPETATPGQWKSLKSLIIKGRPDERFLWPVDLVKDKALPGFGYVMPFRDARFKGIVEWMTRKVRPSFSSLSTTGFQLSDSFLRLHSKGMCYRDVSWGNVFFDPGTGDVLICDNDNVTVDGETSAVMGTKNFMAPEIIRGETGPTINTDLHSLAVLLFYILHLNHPLYGKRLMDVHSLDDAAVERMCGYRPLFIFDPYDSSNEPVPASEDPLGEAGANALVYWSIYPKYLKDMFIRAFTDGINDPKDGRVREGEWRAAMVKLKDSIFHCAGCGAENFYDAYALKASGGKAGKCWACNAELKLPCRMRLGKEVIMLDAATALYPHHLDASAMYDFSRPSALVTGDQLRELRNLSADAWRVTFRDGTEREVVPGNSFTLLDGIHVSFGDVEGEIRI